MRPALMTSEANEKGCNDLCRVGAKIMLTLLISKSTGLFAHSYVTAHLCRNIALKLSLPDSTTIDLYYAGLLHDIGKLTISSSLLLKEDRLTDNEFQIMKNHAPAGEQILRSSDVFGYLQPYIRHHHELPNGKGYPDGLTLEKIPYPVRVLCVADKFSAMTIYRSYRPWGKRSKGEAIDELFPLIKAFFDGNGEMVRDALLCSEVENLIVMALAVSKDVNRVLL
jgi:HD-GYP domain-containing protein (c-di-GMP phosphodiesterase class II)